MEQPLRLPHPFERLLPLLAVRGQRMPRNVGLVAQQPQSPSVLCEQRLLLPSELSQHAVEHAGQSLSLEIVSGPIHLLDCLRPAF